MFCKENMVDGVTEMWNNLFNQFPLIFLGWSNPFSVIHMLPLCVTPM